MASSKVLGQRQRESLQILSTSWGSACRQKHPHACGQAILTRPSLQGILIRVRGLAEFCAILFMRAGMNRFLGGFCGVMPMSMALSAPCLGSCVCRTYRFQGAPLTGTAYLDGEAPPLLESRLLSLPLGPWTWALASCVKPCSCPACPGTPEPSRKKVRWQKTFKKNVWWYPSLYFLFMPPAWHPHENARRL